MLWTIPWTAAFVGYPKAPMPRVGNAIDLRELKFAASKHPDTNFSKHCKYRYFGVVWKSIKIMVFRAFEVKDLKD